MAFIKNSMIEEVNERKRSYVLEPTRQCVFCGETEFDLIGLAVHLNNHCGNFMEFSGVVDEKDYFEKVGL